MGTLLEQIKAKQRWAIEEVLEKYFNESPLKGKYDGMTRYEIAKIILREIARVELEMVDQHRETQRQVAEDAEKEARARGVIKFYLYIKSHTAYPDYEDEVLAFTKEEAAQKFHAQMGYAKAEWSPEDLIEHIVSEVEMNIKS